MQRARYEWIRGHTAVAGAAAMAVSDELESLEASRPRIMIVFSTEDYRHLAQCMGQEAARLNHMPRLAIDIGSAAGNTTEVNA